MSDWDDSKSECTGAPVKSGFGRGNLAKVFANKLRGIGRGSLGSSQSNEVSGRGYATDNSSVPKENGFSSENRGVFGSRTDANNSNVSFSQKYNGDSGFGSGRIETDNHVGVSRINNGFSGGGFSGRTDDDSEKFSNKFNSSGGGFGKGAEEDSSVGYGGRNNSNSGGGFGKRAEGSSFGFGGKSNGDFSRTCDNGSDGFSGKSHRATGNYNSSTSHENAEDSGNSRFGSRGYRDSKERGDGQRNRPGDWTCPSPGCGNSNFAFRQACQKCETAKPGGDGGTTTDFQGRGRGGPDGQRNRPGDWTCPSPGCGNSNFAFRQACQKCETPKPGGDGGTTTDFQGRGKGEPGNEQQRAPVRYIPPTPSDREEDIFADSVSKGINFDKYEEIPVEVSGNNPCGHINSYDEAKLFPTILENIRLAHYEKPTPIQKYSIPTIMEGRNLMACAQTGSGKTAAFLLPVLTAMINQGLPNRQQRVPSPMAICVVPTRELAIQIHADCRKFTHKTDVRAVVVYGGVSLSHQLRQIECGADFVVGTPGRLLDVVRRGKLSLLNVSFLILDEADRMLDMGFEPDIRKLVDTFGMPSKTQRQTLMFSATFPEKIQELAADFLSNYLFVTIGRVGGANTDVSQNFFEVESRDKTKLLIDIIGGDEGGKTLVFVNEKRFVDFLASYLCEMKITATSIHGDRLQQEREEALTDFKCGKRRVLVATSVAARGLDIPEVSHVVNYDLPHSVDEYVHRIGRTGRCGNLGKATSFFNSSNTEIASDLVKILKEAHQPVPEWLAGYACDMPAYHGNATSGQFGGKDIRRDKFQRGDRPSGGNAGGGGNWSAGAGANCDTVVDDESWD